MSTFLPKVLAGHTFDADTVLVGHSGGAALLLAVLEHIDATAAQAILVAGYCTPPNTDAEPVLQATYDWTAIRAHARDLIFINSATDPYGCDDRQGQGDVRSARRHADHPGRGSLRRLEPAFPDLRARRATDRLAPRPPF